MFSRLQKLWVKRSQGGQDVETAYDNAVSPFEDGRSFAACSAETSGNGCKPLSTAWRQVADPHFSMTSSEMTFEALDQSSSDSTDRRQHVQDMQMNRADTQQSIGSLHNPPSPFMRHVESAPVNTIMCSSEYPAAQCMSTQLSNPDVYWSSPAKKVPSSHSSLDHTFSSHHQQSPSAGSPYMPHYDSMDTLNTPTKDLSPLHTGAMPVIAGCATWQAQMQAVNLRAPEAMRRQCWSLDDYTVVSRLHKGGYSAVYKATCHQSGMPVCLKVYFLNRVPENVLHMVVREMVIHEAMDHKHVVALHGKFQDPKHLVMVQEYAGKGDLYGISRRLLKPLTEKQLLTLIVRPLMRALAHLHGKGIVHRDIKPENILFTDDWTLKLADFGVSIDLTAERAVTRSGTEDYMAPEVARCPLKHRAEDNKDNDNLAYGMACDVYSAGVVIAELLTRARPELAELRVRSPGWYARLAPEMVRLVDAGELAPHAIDFITATLADDPRVRPTARQLLDHPWLA